MVALIVVVFFAFRIVLETTLGLGVDESYGISVAHDLRLSYFDHPPLHYWIAHFFMPLLGDGRALRLPFNLLFIGTNWALYLLTRQLFGAASGFWAVLALNLSAFFTLAGGWVIPDGPLMFCLLAAAYTVACALFPAEHPPSRWRTWIVAGMWIGFAALSKYHALLFVVGLFTYVVTIPARRNILLHAAPWLGAVIALLVASPAIIWNAEHHWVSIAFQAGRASGHGFPKIGNMLANIGGQFVWMLPWIFVPMVIAAYRALRQGRDADRSWYCLCLAFPSIALFTLVPLWGDRGLPHWQMPGWLMLFPVLGNYLAREAAIRSRPRTWAITSAILLVVLAAVIVGHAATGYGRILFPAAFVKRDPTLEAFEWTPLRAELEKRGLLKRNGLFIVSAHWTDMGKIDLALHDELPMQIFGESKEYAFRYDEKMFVGHDALVIGLQHHMYGIDAALKDYFSSVEELPPFVFGRAGMHEVNLRILYAHDLKWPLPNPYASPQINRAGKATTSAEPRHQCRRQTKIALTIKFQNTPTAAPARPAVCQIACCS
jgi:Dolichyl-phosphate-mannose-protein mannosyltransferase